MQVAQRNGLLALRYANKKLRDNRDLVYAAINSGRLYEGFKYVSERLRNDEDVALFALERGADPIGLPSNLLDSESFLIKAASRFKDEYDISRGLC